MGVRLTSGAAMAISNFRLAAGGENLFAPAAGFPHIGRK
jgi:hypothetical protein